MKITTLTLKNFRNISETELLPCDEMNIICGKNANGKTNIIEAIWLFTGAKSFRTNKDAVFIKFGEEKATAAINFFSDGIEKEAKIEISDRRYAFLNENSLQNASGLAGEFNAIIFSPADLEIVKGAPINRRNFIDTAIGQIYPNYINFLRNYKRAVTQRNRIIKNFKYDASISFMLDSFEKEIAENGIKIIGARRKFLNRIKNYLSNIYEGISDGKETLKTEYICVCEGEELRERLIEARKEDIISGITSVGPHRDDIDFKINEKSVRTYGSQGQNRSVALSLKLAEAEVIKEISGEYPVCLLDDVMSELDPERQNYILNHIKGWQSFLTCCDPSNIKNFKEGKVFYVENGSVKQ